MNAIDKYKKYKFFWEQFYLGRYDLLKISEQDKFFYLESVWDNKVLYFSSNYGVSRDEARSIVYQFKDYKDRFPDTAFNYVNNLLQLNLSRPSDITQYKTFKELKDMVLTFKSVFDTRPDLSEKDVELDDGEILYRDEHVEIARALSRNACVIIGQNDKWCISRERNNFFYNYRFSKEEPTFYFVKNFDFFSLDEKDSRYKYRFFILSVLNDSEEKNRYKITSFLNERDSETNWENIVQICPHLKDKKHFFVHVSLSDREKVLKDKFYKKTYTADEFRNLSYTNKELFLDLNIQPLDSIPDAFWFLLPKELKKKYILMQGKISGAMLKEIAKDKELNATRFYVAKNILIRLPKYIDEYLFYIRENLFSGFNSEKFLSDDLIKKNKKSLAYLLMFVQDEFSLKTFLEELDFTKKEDADLAIDVFNYIKDETFLSKYVVPYLSNILIYSSDSKFIEDEVVLSLFVKFYGIEALPKELSDIKLMALIEYVDTDVFLKRILQINNLIDPKKIKALFSVLNVYPSSFTKDILPYLKNNLVSIILNANEEDIPLIFRTCYNLLNDKIILSVASRLRKIKDSFLIAECLTIEPVSLLLLKNKAFNFNFLEQDDLIDIIYADVNATLSNFCLNLLKQTLKKYPIKDFSTIKDILSTSSAVKVFNLFEKEINEFSDEEKLELLKLDVAPLLIKKISSYKQILNSVNDYKKYVEIFSLDETLDNPLFKYLWNNGYIRYDAFPKTAYLQIAEKYRYNPLKLNFTNTGQSASPVETLQKTQGETTSEDSQTQLKESETASSKASKGEDNKT